MKIQHLQYLPFGESFVTQTSSGWESRYNFIGKEKNQETGYSYFGARYYDSDLLVWLSVDPLASKYPSMSPYMYTAGNPVMLVDPDGMLDDAYVYGTALILGHDKMRHLTGEGANRKELTNSGLNTLTNFVPITKMGRALGIGKQTLNIAEYSSKYAGTNVLKGFTPAQRGMNLRIRNVYVRQNNALIKTLPPTMWGVSFMGFLTND